MRTPRHLLILALLFVLTACVASEMPKGPKGADFSSIRPGVTKSEVEALLGLPVRSWGAKQGIWYAVYTVGRYHPGDKTKAVGAALLDIATIGGYELMTEAGKSPKFWTNIVVSYDDDDIVLGLFDEFDPIPRDGRSAKRPSVLSPESNYPVSQ